MNIEQALTELGQERRDAADPESLRPFINEMELCDLEDQAYKGVAHRNVKGGRLYVRHHECALDPKCVGHRRYWFEDGCDYAEVTRDQALELL